MHGVTIEIARAAHSSAGGTGYITPLAEGMSSQAWVGAIAGRESVIRTPVPGTKRPDPDYRSEANLNAALRAAGVPATDMRVVEIDGVLCSIAPRVLGEPIRPHQWSDSFVTDLATALAATHSIPVDGHRLPTSVRRFHLARIWPLDGTSLDDHPVRTEIPGLVDVARSKERAIRAEAARAPRVVHSDLHWDHLIRSTSGRLAGILDFGDAFAGPPAWDFACLRYYHGDEVGQRVAAAYPNGATIHRRSLPLGIAFALYKLDKTPHRADVIERVEHLIRAA